MEREPVDNIRANNIALTRMQDITPIHPSGYPSGHPLLHEYIHPTLSLFGVSQGPTYLSLAREFRQQMASIDAEWSWMKRRSDYLGTYVVRSFRSTKRQM